MADLDELIAVLLKTSCNLISKLWHCHLSYCPWCCRDRPSTVPSHVCKVLDKKWGHKWGLAAVLDKTAWAKGSVTSHRDTLGETTKYVSKSLVRDMQRYISSGRLLLKLL